MKTLICICCVLVFFSCKDKPTEPPASPNISGTWEGKGSKSGISYTVTMKLSQSVGDTVITGTGDISAFLTKIEFSIAGVNVYPDVRMKFTNPDPSFANSAYSGRFDLADDNSINGKATVPGFGIINESLLLKRIGY